MENSVPGLAGRAVPAGPRHAIALHRGSPERVKITGTISWRQFVPTPKISDGTTNGGETQEGHVQD
jgi:hypothetical protein